MTKNELIAKIDNGSDIMFDIGSRHFTILTWMDDGIAIGEQYPNDGKMQYYCSAKALVEQFLIDGKALEEYANSIVITDYTLNGN